MTGPILDLVGIWTVILGLGVFFYVLLDGFDLGVGMLYGLHRDTASRGIIMNSIAPIWDGNETWLILGGLALLAAFPLAFAIIIPALYFPVLLMLLALIFRGVAFEFRFKDKEHRGFWDHGFCYGSAVATFAQGTVLGSFIQGFQVEGRHFTGTSFDWFTPFSVLTGFALMAGYCLLGAGWLVLKTQVDALCRGRYRGTLVLLAEPGLARARADRGAGIGLRRLAQLRARPGSAALRLFDRPVPDGLSGHRDQPVAEHRAASLFAVGGGIFGKHPGVPAGRHAVPAAGHSALYRLVLLGVPGQGEGRRRLSLRAAACGVFGSGC